jgi:predicted Zn-dependent peptidase
MIDIVRREVDGLRVFWCDAPPPFVALLAFRVGAADETLATRGITHLLEHLAVAPRHRSFAYNATVEPTRTIFWASGESVDALAFIDEASASLASPPLERLETERRILRSEEASNWRSNAWTRLLNTRFGSRGFGLLDELEYGLRRVQSDEVADWARRWFTRENAVLWLTAAPPEGFDVPLPHGASQPLPPHVSRDLQLPALLQWGSGGVGISFLGPHSLAFTSGIEIARRRTHARLRYELGVSYNTASEYARLSNDLAYGFLVSDILAGRVVEARDALVDTLDTLADSGATREELDTLTTELERWTSSPTNAAEVLGQVAVDELNGLEPTSPAELLAEHEALTGSEVAETIRAALETAVLLVPADVEAELARFATLPEWVDPPLEGRVFRMRRSGRLKGRPPIKFVVADEAFSLVDEGGYATLRFDEIAALIIYDDGFWILAAENGLWLRLHPDSFDHAAEIEESVRARIPAARIVEMGEPWSKD